MNQRTQPVIDSSIDDMFEIVPGDIQSGFEPDGTPRTEPAVKPNGTVSKQPRQRATLAELAKAREDAANAAVAKGKAEQDAETARKERQAVEARLAEAERQLGTTTDHAMKAHLARTVSDYRQAYTTQQTLAAQAASADAQIAAAERDYDAAEDAGDRKRSREAMRNIAKLEAEKLYLQGMAQSADAAVKDAHYNYEQAYYAMQAPAGTAKPAATPAAQPEKTEKPAEPAKVPSADEFISACPAEAQTWLRDHKEFAQMGTDANRRLLNFARVYADDHGGEGAWNTAEFRSALDAKFFPKADTTDQHEEDGDELEDTEMADDTTQQQQQAAAQAAAQQQRRSAASAPVSRPSGNGRPGSNPNTIKLTQEQYAIAPDLYPSYDDLSPDARAKFPAWSPQAARWQYHHDLQRAHKDGKFRSS